MNSTFDSVDRTSIEDSEPERLMLYRSAVQNCLQDISSSVKLGDFNALFQGLPSFSKKQHLVGRFHSILTEYINQSVYQQVQEHIQEAELLEKFAKLERLIVENAANKGKEEWRPSHDVRSDLKSYRMQEKLAFKEELERMITAKEDAVNKLKYDILTTEKRAKELEERINNAEDCLNTINNRIDVFMEGDSCMKIDVTKLI